MIRISVEEVIAQACPACGALVGKHCISMDARHQRTHPADWPRLHYRPHGARRDAAYRARAGKGLPTGGRINWISEMCSTCGAQPGSPCVAMTPGQKPRGEPIGRVHAARLRAARAALVAPS